MTLLFHFLVDGFPPKDDFRENLIKELFDGILSRFDAELEIEGYKMPFLLSEQTGKRSAKKTAYTYGYKYSASFDSDDMELIYYLRQSLTSWHSLVAHLVRTYPAKEWNYDLLFRPPHFELKGIQ